MVALGWRHYIADRMNIVDFFVCVASWAEMVAGLVVEIDGGVEGFVGMVGLIRVFRVFRIVGAFPGLRVLLDTAVESLVDVRDFSVLVVTYITTCSLVSMELYAYRVRYNVSDNSPWDAGNGDKILESYSPRLNFDTFLNSFVSNFIILSVDNWNEVMHQTYRCTGSVFTVLYFCFLVFFGALIL